MEFGSKFNDIALCLSNNESLIWSARRKSWDGPAVAMSTPSFVAVAYPDRIDQIGSLNQDNTKSIDKNRKRRLQGWFRKAYSDRRMPAYAVASAVSTDYVDVEIGGGYQAKPRLGCGLREVTDMLDCDFVVLLSKCITPVQPPLHNYPQFPTDDSRTSRLAVTNFYTRNSRVSTRDGWPTGRRSRQST